MPRRNTPGRGRGRNESLRPRVQAGLDTAKLMRSLERRAKTKTGAPK